jgi:hypothetical protein
MDENEDESKNWIDRLEQEEKIDKAGSATLDRLQMLVQKGYQPDFSGELLGAIWLYHPRESFEHKRLILYGSGLVVSVNDKSDKYRFGREETQAFNRFLQTIPTPSFWEHTRRGRINVYAWLMICGVMLGGGLLGVIAVEFVKRLWQ